jgi:hypothetical protein
MRNIIAMAAAACVAGWLGSHAALAADNDDQELIKAVNGSKITLQEGLTSGQRNGRPISAKFENEDGKLQLSVYTEKDGKFFEVIVDHGTGLIAKTEPITEGDDLADAKAQSAAMAKAKSDLKSAVDKAAGSNRAVSVTPDIKDGQVVATVVMATNGLVQTVRQPLD